MISKLIYINRRPVVGVWGGGNRFLTALIAAIVRAGHSVTHEPQRCDAAIAVGVERASFHELSAEQTMQLARDCSAVGIFRVNDCDARKNTDHVDASVRRACALATQTVFVSKWLREYFRIDGTVIVNGVDKTVFKKSHHTASTLPRVITHHWSDNRMKGAEWYEALDRAAAERLLLFTYVGRHKCNFTATTVIPPCDGQELARHLTNHDVYVSGSEHDPGPNHVLEAIACEMPIIVRITGGGAVEFAGARCATRTSEQMLHKILTREYSLSETCVVSWEECVSHFLELLQ